LDRSQCKFPHAVVAFGQRSRLVARRQIGRNQGDRFGFGRIDPKDNGAIGFHFGRGKRRPLAALAFVLRLGAACQDEGRNQRAGKAHGVQESHVNAPFLG